MRKLVWSDEFDYVGPPNPEKWNFQVGDHGWGNNELQMYTDGANAWVDGEKLIIEARKEGDQITSTRMNTSGKGDWLYGRIEVRAKVPKLKGTWPAIWMLPTDWEYGGWPKSGEIDIMEHVGYDLDVIHTTIHTEAFHHEINTHIGVHEKLEGATDEFKVYAMEWTPEELTWFVDGKKQFVYKPEEHCEKVTSAEWPYNKRFHLLLNLAFGGDWGGAQGVDLDGLPARFEVDWVRVYQ